MALKVYDVYYNITFTRPLRVVVFIDSLRFYFLYLRKIDSICEIII